MTDDGSDHLSPTEAESAEGLHLGWLSALVILGSALLLMKGAFVYAFAHYEVVGDAPLSLFDALWMMSSILGGLLVLATLWFANENEPRRAARVLLAGIVLASSVDVFLIVVRLIQGALGGATFLMIETVLNVGVLVLLVAFFKLRRDLKSHAAAQLSRPSSA